MSRSIRFNAFTGLAGALCLLLMSGAARSQVLNPTVTTVNGLFHYDYTVINNTPGDLFDVSIYVLPGAGQVTNVSAPVGFKSAYDSGLGIVDYLADTSNFTAGAAISGFTYDSTLGPSASTFDANYTPTSGGILTQSGATLAARGPGAPITSVPEGGSLTLLCSALCFASGIALARKKRCSAR